MTAGFGGQGYSSPQTRALSSIAKSPNADVSSQEKLVELLQQHSSQIRFLAANQKKLQQGVNDATANPIKQIQQFIADVTVLLGGGELVKGALDFGDLQYMLPAVGALLGLGDGPFPVDLFQAAQKFFLGYVVPTQQFTDVVNTIIENWLSVFGIDQEFVGNVKALVTAFGQLFDGVGNLFPSLNEFFTALGLDGGDLGPLGQVLGPIIQLFAGIDLTKFGNAIEFITDAISPFIQQLTAIINFINGVLAVLGYDDGDVVNSPLAELTGFWELVIANPISNLRAFFQGIDLTASDFNPAEAAADFVNAVLLPLNLLLGPNSPLAAGNIFGQLQLPQFGGGVSITDLTTATANLLEPFTEVSVPTADGWSYDAVEDAARVIADGTTKTLYLRSGVIKVEEGQPLNTSISVKYSGVTSGAGQTIRYVLETFTSTDGSGTPTPVTVAAITNPTGSAGPTALGDSSWDIPAGVQSVRPALVVGELVTAGTVWWLNTPHLHKILLGVLADGIAAAVQERIAEMQAVLDAFKGSAGGAVADIATALNNAGQATRDAIVQALGGTGTGHSPAQVLTHLQNIPREVVTGLENILTEVADSFDGQAFDPVSAVGTKVKGLLDLFFFGGGPKTVVSQERIAAASGIPPMDAIVKIPYVYLPEEFMSVAMGMPWCEMSKPSNQSISASTETVVTGWNQDGPAVLTIASNRFKPAFDGMWNIEIGLKWAGTVALYQNNVKIREFTGNTGVMHTMIPAATTDEFHVTVYHTSSGTVTAADTTIRATYLGFTTVPSLPPPAPDVTFDAAGDGDWGLNSYLEWDHTFGADAGAVVVPISHQDTTAPVVTIGMGMGNFTVPVLSGPTYIGNYTIYAARHSLAAAIIPPALKGTTRTIRVTWANQNEVGSASSQSFNHATALGTVFTNSGDGNNASLMVPSNVSSQVAVSFASSNNNFSSFNRTQDFIRSFSAFNHWPHVIGHYHGGALFTANNGGKWTAKGIELHN